MRCYPWQSVKNWVQCAGRCLWPYQLVLSPSCMQARLKSLYSTHRKMQRKGVPVTSVYDVRALRVIVSDAGRRLLPDAVEACYAILPVVHRLWRQVLREADDYIANPTPSGYQSLHTAVTGEPGCTVWHRLHGQGALSGQASCARASEQPQCPRWSCAGAMCSRAAAKPSAHTALHVALSGSGSALACDEAARADAHGIPMEVQVRTSSMHEVAEYGPAAHWAYKARGANPINPVRTVQVWPASSKHAWAPRFKDCLVMCSTACSQR